MKVFGAVMRIYSYLFHLILALFFLAVSIVTLIGGHHNLSLQMLPWSGETLTKWLLGLSLFAILSVVLAVMGKLRILLVVWSLFVLVMMVRGFFLSGYTFGGPDQARGAAWLTFGAVGAFFGALMSLQQKKRSYR